MKTIKFTVLSLSVFLFAFCFSLQANAGTISGSLAPTGPGLGTLFVATITTPNPGNDNQTGGTPAEDNNIGVPLKKFEKTDYIDLVFTVVADANETSGPDGIATEYSIIESVDNDTGVAWGGYKMYLGTGTGAGFVMSGAGDGLDFDAPDYDLLVTSTGFTSVAMTEDTLSFSGGSHSSGSEVYTFRIDVPDGITEFTLRQMPTQVPEPSSIALLVLGAVALIGGKRFASK